MANSTVLAPLAMVRMADQNWPRPSTSIAAVGSSSRAIQGRRQCHGETDPFPLATRELRGSHGRRSRSVPVTRQPASSLQRMGVVRGHQGDQLPDPKSSDRRAALEHAPDAAGVHPLRRRQPNTGPRAVSGRVSPRIMSMVVVLPAPFGPSRATVSPGVMTSRSPGRPGRDRRT